MKKRSLLFQTSSLPRKQVVESGTAAPPLPHQQANMTKSEGKKGGERVGGIPRPQGAVVSGSPSKLAVRTTTNRVNSGVSSSVNPGHGKHEGLSRTASGEGRGGSGPTEAQYKMQPATTAYSRAGQRTLVNDKLYPRIPHPAPPLFHPSAPQRSQTLSLIPSHSSTKTKMGIPAKVPNMPGSTQVRFGPPDSRMPSPAQYNPTSGPIKGIMKAGGERLEPPTTNSQAQQTSSSQQTSTSSSASALPPNYRGPTSHSSQPSPYPGAGPSGPSGPSPYPGLVANQSAPFLGPAATSQAGYLNSQSSSSQPSSSSFPAASSAPSYPGPPAPSYPAPHQYHPQQQSHPPQNKLPHFPVPWANNGQQQGPRPPGPPAYQYLGARDHPAHPTPPPYHQPPQPPPAPHPQVQDRSRDSEAEEDAAESRRQQAEMGKRLASAKSDLKRLAAENGNITSEFSKKVAEQQNEMRSMKELNARLSEDNQELRDLCCFLDDDRQKGRKLAREWQRFGRYTASVMRQEVSNYQSKLKELAGKQEDLIRDNLELKELCLYLDEERSGGGGGVCTECGGPSSLSPPIPSGVTLAALARDEGDGSSRGSNDESEVSGSNLVEEMTVVRARENLYKQSGKMGLNDEVLLYIRNLEDRVGQLESGSEFPYKPVFPISTPSKTKEQVEEDDDDEEVVLSKEEGGVRPESVSNAMKVLEVHEDMLERGGETGLPGEDLGDGEKALVREMCNVVWRKLEEG